MNHPINTEEIGSSRRAFLSRTARIGAMGAVTLAGARPLWAQTAATPETATPNAATPTPKLDDAKIANPTESQTAEAEMPAASASDLEILGFALGLERLEAAFYAQVLGAHENRAFLSARLLESARAIGATEIAHTEALQNAILAAGGQIPDTANFRFPAQVFISPVAFSWFGYTLEEIGIGAYLGAVGQIQSRQLRQAAASIYGAEVRHAALLRSMGGFTFSPRYFESPLSVPQVQKLIAPYVG